MLFKSLAAVCSLDYIILVLHEYVSSHPASTMCFVYLSGSRTPHPPSAWSCVHTYTQAIETRFLPNPLIYLLFVFVKPQELLVLVRQEGVLHREGPQRRHARRPQVRAPLPRHGQVRGCVDVLVSVWMCGSMRVWGSSVLPAAGDDNCRSYTCT